jgi:hypothetical protein
VRRLPAARRLLRRPASYSYGDRVFLRARVRPSYARSVQPGYAPSVPNIAGPGSSESNWSAFKPS